MTLEQAQEQFPRGTLFLTATGKIKTTLMIDNLSIKEYSINGKKYYDIVNTGKSDMSFGCVYDDETGKIAIKI